MTTAATFAMPHSSLVVAHRSLLTLIAALGLTLAGQAAAATALWFAGSANPEFTAPPDSIAATVQSDKSVLVGAFTPNFSKSYQLRLAAAKGAQLAPGAYEATHRYPFHETAHGLSGSGSVGGSCIEVGRFVVLEAVYGANNTVTSLAVNFEGGCSMPAPTQYGELRFNSAIPFTYQKPAGATTPDAFAFLPRTLLAPGTVMESNQISVFGTNAASPISIVGGEYSVNGGPYVSTPGSVNFRDKVKVRATASNTPGGTTEATLTIGGVSGTFMLTTYQPGQAQTGFRYSSAPGEWIGQGETHFHAAPADDFGVSRRFDNGISIDNSNSDASYWSLEFAGPGSTPLAVGPYEEAGHAAFHGAAPGLAMSGNGRGCTYAGRFVVLEVEYDPVVAVSKLALDFELRCKDGNNLPLYGEIRLNSTLPFTFQKAAGSTAPNAFSFNAFHLLNPGQMVESRAVGIYGINAPAPISVVDGEYSVNGGAYASAAGTVVNRDVVRVRATASTTPGATVNAMLTVGGVSAPFALTTYQPGQTQSGFWYRDIAGVERFARVPDDSVTTSRVFNAGVQVQARSGAHQWDVQLFGPSSAAPAVGVFEQASFFRGHAPTLSFANGYACTATGARFVVFEAEYDVNYNVVKFAADFEQRCGPEAAPIFGEVRINSTLPFTHQKPAASTAPNPFAFGARTHLAPGTVVESNHVTAYGINAPAAISITNGEYSINGAAYTSAAGTVVNGDRLRVRATASATPGATVNAVLSVGGVSGTFAVSTYALGQVQTALWFQQTLSGGASGETRLIQAPADVITVYPFADRGPEIGASQGAQNWTLKLDPKQSRLVPGAYEAAERVPFNGSSFGLNFGNFCNQLTGRFVVLEADYLPSGEINRLAVNFEQRCEYTQPPLYGEVRINSTVPFTHQEAPGATDPDAFRFKPVNLVQPGEMKVSNYISVYGTNAPSPVSIAGGEYSVNDAPFTSAPGTVNNRDRVRLRATAVAQSTVNATLTVGSVSATFAVNSYQTGQVVNAFWYQSLPGDVVGQGRTELFVTPAASISTSRINAQGGAQAGLWASAFEASRGYDIRFGSSAPRLLPGAYEMAVGAAIPGNTPSLAMGSCSDQRGRFVVLEATYHPDGTAISFAANFEQRCGENAPPVYGEFRFNSTVPLTQHKPANSTTPNAFAFAPVDLQPTGVLVESNLVAVDGINAPAAISIVGGEYSVNGAAYTSAPGMVVNRDRVKVRVMSSGTPGATVSATLAIGGVTGIFSVTTYQPGQVVTGLWVQSTPGDAVGQGRTYLYSVPRHFVEVLGSFGNVNVNVNTGLEYWHVYLTAPGNVNWQPGLYEADRFSSSTKARLDARANSRGCNTVVGSVRVLEAVYSQFGALQRFAANFTQRCGASGQPLHGELRFNSSIPLSFQTADTAQLTVGKFGTGTGTVTSAPAGINCGATCTASMTMGSVTLTAAPAAGSSFTGWSNVACAQGNAGAACTFILSAVANPVAMFSTAFKVVSDFNGDGRSDILWHNSATGMLYELQMSGFAPSTAGVIDQEADLDWRVAAVADLNNDGRADVVWQNGVTGQVYGLLMNGTAVDGEGTIYSEPNTQWKIAGAGDFNGDGSSDLLWKNGVTGEVFLLLMNGLTVTGGGVIYSEPNTNWQIQRVADFDGDGRADVLWRNVATGDVFVLLMSGTTVTGGGVIYSEPNTAWQIQAASDFNGDGRGDILWRNTTTGDVYMMLMNGTTITDGSVIYGEPNTDWKIVATGDYNGDGRADILWRNTATGQVFMMLMNGFTITQGDFVYTESDQNWKIIGP